MRGESEREIELKRRDMAALLGVTNRISSIVVLFHDLVHR